MIDTRQIRWAVYCGACAIVMLMLAGCECYFPVNLDTTDHAHAHANITKLRWFHDYQSRIGNMTEVEQRAEELRRVRKYQGNSVQTLRFLCWIIEDEPHLRIELLKQWLGVHKAMGSLPPIDVILPRIKELVGFYPNEEQYQRIKELKAVYIQVCKGNGYPYAESPANNDPSVDYPPDGFEALCDDSQPMGLSMFSPDRAKVRNAFDITLGRRNKVPYSDYSLVPRGVNTITYAVSLMEKGLNISCSPPGSVQWNENQQEEERYTEKSYDYNTWSGSVYAHCLSEVLQSLNYVPDGQFECIERYLKYLKGQDVQLLRLLIYATSGDSKVRCEVMNELLCSGDYSLSYDELKERLSFSLLPWTDEERSVRIKELEGICGRIEKEKRIRKPFHYNLDDGKGYWVLSDLAKQDVLSDSGIFAVSPGERQRIYHGILERQPFSCMGSDTIWTALWVLEPDPQVRADLSKKVWFNEGGHPESRFWERMNREEKERRTAELRDIQCPGLPGTSMR